MNTEEVIDELKLPYSLRYYGKPLEELSREELIEACKATYQMYVVARRDHQATLDIFRPLEEKDR